MEVKDNMKRSAYQIKRPAASKADPSNSDRYTSARLPCKKKSRTSVLPDRKHKGKKIPDHKGSQSYYILYKKAGMIELNYKSHSSEIALEKGLTRYPSRKALEGA